MRLTLRSCSDSHQADLLASGRMADEEAAALVAKAEKKLKGGMFGALFGFSPLNLCPGIVLSSVHKSQSEDEAGLQCDVRA
jgi:hypothetical protein